MTFSDEPDPAPTPAADPFAAAAAPAAAGLTDAVAARVAAAVAGLRASEAALRADRAPESLHAMRVALRRLRSLVRAFRDLWPQAAVDLAQAQLAETEMPQERRGNPTFKYCRINFQTKCEDNNAL